MLTCRCCRGGAWSHQLNQKAVQRRIPYPAASSSQSSRDPLQTLSVSLKTPARTQRRSRRNDQAAACTCLDSIRTSGMIRLTLLQQCRQISWHGADMFCCSPWSRSLWCISSCSLRLSGPADTLNHSGLGPQQPCVVVSSPPTFPHAELATVEEGTQAFAVGLRFIFYRFTQLFGFLLCNYVMRNY